MEKRFKIAIVVVIALAVIIIALNITNQSTGKATLTQGASYGKISRESSKYTNCVYISEDDSWDVSTRATIQYYDSEEKKTGSVSDSCVDSKSLVEYDCDGEFRNRRTVLCPANMVCKNGACVSQ